MNNYPYPIQPMINNYNNDILAEILKINRKLEQLENRINNLEKEKDNKNYLKKEDNYYIV